MIIAKRILTSKCAIRYWSVLIIDRAPTPCRASINRNTWSIRTAARGRSFITRTVIANKHVGDTDSPNVFDINEVRKIIGNIPYHYLGCPLQGHRGLAYSLREGTSGRKTVWGRTGSCCGVRITRRSANGIRTAKRSRGRAGYRRWTGRNPNGSQEIVGARGALIYKAVAICSTIWIRYVGIPFTRTSSNSGSACVGAFTCRANHRTSNEIAHWNEPTSIRLCHIDARENVIIGP